VAIGSNVRNVSVGDEVMAMADSNKDGGWATGGTGGYAIARDYLTVQKSPSLSFDEAAVLPICFLSAYIGIYRQFNPGDTIYNPDGAGGVGHLAIQMAAQALGASRVISSGSKPDTIAQAKKFGASHALGASPLLSESLEERVAEDAVRLSRSAKTSNTCIEGFGIGDAGLNRRFANALDHRGERLPGESVDEVGSARIDIHHARRYVNRFQTRLDHKWIELPANQRIASRQSL
jgi:hypothetical protein